MHGSLYCGTDPFNTVVRIAPDGTMETILTAADGLDGPTAVLFGRNNEGFDLYMTNAAFPFFPVPPPRLPSLLRLQAGRPRIPPAIAPRLLPLHRTDGPAGRRSTFHPN